ncbi:MAG: hypothetical protein PUA52_02250 [Lachnospiraceae bacterium]|nr:hypothetical protein [Lachnospiraceae bacterium]
MIRKMKQIVSLVLLTGLVFTSAVSVNAETLSGSDSWQVEFTQAGKMTSNFRTADLNDVVTGMQPGDTALLSVRIRNSHESSTDWYMANGILASMEDNSPAKGGAYTYNLTYTADNGTALVLFDSDTVGGDDAQGLHSAEEALKDYLYVDTLAAGEGGTVSLTISLDGETQGNSYQNTLADLSLRFATQLTPVAVNTTVTTTTTTTGKAPVVKTGDETMLTPYILTAAISGLVLLLFAIFCARKRKSQEEEA